MQQGWNLLADDLVAINDQDFVLPGVSQLAMGKSLKERYSNNKFRKSKTKY